MHACNYLHTYIHSYIHTFSGFLPRLDQCYLSFEFVVLLAWMHHTNKLSQMLLYPHSLYAN